MNYSIADTYPPKLSELLAMRIYFVGIHSKPGMAPLDSRTRSGKVVDSIIVRLKFKGVCFKTNLTERERMPTAEELPAIRQIWKESYNPQNGDIVVLFGRFVHDNFPELDTKAKVLKLAHPASEMHHRTKDAAAVYVTRATEIIQNAIDAPKA